MTTGINDSRTLAKHILCKCECNFDGRKCNLNQKWDNNKCRCECKNLKKTLCVRKRLAAKMVNTQEILLVIQ